MAWVPPAATHGSPGAAEQFRRRFGAAAQVEVTLYGSLSLTGRGHLTDRAVQEGLAPLACSLTWQDEALPFHPNGMRFRALDAVGGELGRWTVFSVGGGELREEGQAGAETPEVYPQGDMAGVLAWSAAEGRPIWALADELEGQKLWEHLGMAWERMQAAIRAGLREEGALPGALRLMRKARSVLAQAARLKRDEARTGLVSAYALAVAEHNAGGGFVVTAPTCGSCGVLPAVLYFLHHDRGHEEARVLKALATAGIIGNVVKKNASISGAEVGCQGEVGVACAMAAGAAAQLLGGTPHQVEYAAEIGLEHHLGLTCDPILGLVQVPCIERNAFAAISALACAEYALLSDGRHLVSFDQVVEAMQQTGHDLPTLYRETARGGLARVYRPGRG